MEEQIENQEDVSEENKSKKTGKRLKKVVCIVIAANLGIVGALYLSGALFFQEHFLPNTQIDGVNYGWKDIGQVETDIQERTSQYELTIYGRDDVTDKICGYEIGMTPVFDGSLKQIQEEQNGFEWVSALWNPYSYEISKVVQYDPALLDEKLESLNIFQWKNQKHPIDAYIGEYEEETNSYSIVPEIPGSDIIREAAAELIAEALSALQSELDLQDAACFQEPKVTTETAWINRVVKTLNKYVSSEIIYDWNGTEEIIDGTLIHNWLYVDDKKVWIDEEKVRGYVDELAKKNDTFGKQREFVTTEGETVTLAGGSYGWWSNRADETQELVALIKKGETVEREPIYRAQGYAKGQDDIGDSYVEVNLEQQHLYLYIEGQLELESDFVSGNTSRGNGTPPGVFGITYKERNATLRGENYATPVSYWMPFNGNIGLHDANWRRSFGGKIYRTNGSHGCVNLPPDIAAEIYEKVEKGFPVVCYN